jgi:hypothetical protein
LCSLAAVLAVASGCTQSPERETANQGEPPIGALLVIADLSTFTLPLDPYRQARQNLDATTKAEGVLMRQCLRRFGFEPPPDRAPSAAATGYQQRYGITNGDQAAARGYHGPPRPAEEGPSADVLSPAAQAVMSGDGQRSYAGQQVPEGGCAGEARRKLAEGVPQVEDKNFGSYLASESWERSKVDSRVRAAFVDWSACMKRAGYDYADPFKANDNPEFGDAEPTAGEIAVAVADVRCKKEANVVSIWATVETAYQQRSVEKHGEALAAIRKNFEAQEKNAAAVLAAA